MNWLIHKFVPRYEETADPSVRQAYGTLAGAMGVLLNLVLFLLKLPLGLIVGSMAVTSDAFNNLSDMGASVIALLSARLALRHPDREHPFGHGRVEYICALGVSVLIILVGVQLFIASVGQWTRDEVTSFDPVMLIVLLISMLVKGWMFFFDRNVGKRIASPVLMAAATDSINDVFVTAAVLICSILARFVPFALDALCGIGISVLILISGIRLGKDTIDLLLGGKPDPELVNQIRTMILTNEHVTGVHDLILHDYGPGRVMASAHAEVPVDIDIMVIHEIIDDAEHRIFDQLRVPIVIHIDPIAVHDETVQNARAQVATVIHRVNSAFSFHDFRMVDGVNRVNLIFDLVVPCELSEEKRRVAVDQIEQALAKIDPRHHAIIYVDDDYSG